MIMQKKANYDEVMQGQELLIKLDDTPHIARENCVIIYEF